METTGIFFIGVVFSQPANSANGIQLTYLSDLVKVQSTDAVSKFQNQQTLIQALKALFKWVSDAIKPKPPTLNGLDLTLSEHRHCIVVL